MTRVRSSSIFIEASLYFTSEEIGMTALWRTLYLRSWCCVICETQVILEGFLKPFIVPSLDNLGKLENTDYKVINGALLLRRDERCGFSIFSNPGNPDQAAQEWLDQEDVIIDSAAYLYAHSPYGGICRKCLNCPEIVRLIDSRNILLSQNVVTPA